MTIDKSFEIYELLRKHIKDDADAKAIVRNIEAIVEEKINDKKDVLATKQDISNLEVKMADTKSEIIKWMFIFWVGTIGVLSGIMFALLHAYLK
jgi:hypothetical protein